MFQTQNLSINPCTTDLFWHKYQGPCSPADTPKLNAGIIDLALKSQMFAVVQVYCAVKFKESNYGTGGNNTYFRGLVNKHQF